jgi:hypothetical protein
MPDSLSVIAAPRGLSFAQHVALLRRPLPSHALEGGNFRRWAVSVLHAETKHRDADFSRVEQELGVSVDRWDFPNCVIVGQYPHEARAGEALLWLSALQTHESEKRTPFNFKVWRDWHPKWRRAWIEKRRYLWRGFLNAVRDYQHARQEAGL